VGNPPNHCPPALQPRARAVSSSAQSTSSSSPPPWPSSPPRSAPASLVLVADTAPWARIVGIVRIGIVVQVVVGLALDRLELRADDHVSLAWGE
jgi:hypothetical protein